MKNKIKAVIFDQDGLMFDTERLSAEAWELAGADMGIQVGEEFLKTIRGTNAQDALIRMAEYFAGTGIDPVRLREKKKEYFSRIRSERPLPVKPGLYELLAYLKKQGYGIALATASDREYSLENLKEAGIADYFAHMITGDMVARAKPSPEIFIKAAQALGEAPEHCLVLEDSINGVEAGLAGGFVTVMVPDLTRPDEALTGRLFRVCESLFEVRDLLAQEDIG